MTESTSGTQTELFWRLSTPWGRRHVKGVAIIRALVAVWLTILATIFCARGDWAGAVLYLVAGLVGALAYLMPRWKAALNTLEIEGR